MAWERAAEFSSGKSTTYSVSISILSWGKEPSFVVDRLIIKELEPPAWTRTCCRWFTKPLLIHMSFGGVVPVTGLEPASPVLKVQYLTHRPHRLGGLVRSEGVEPPRLSALGLECAWRDSNSHSRSYFILREARIPIPTQALACDELGFVGCATCVSLSGTRRMDTSSSSIHRAFHG